MKVNKLELAICVFLAPVFFGIGYNDIYLFSREGQMAVIEDAVQDAISSSGREDLEFSQISGYYCDDLNRKKQDNKIRTYNCATSAVFANGTSAKVSIQKKEYAKMHSRRGKKRRDVYKIEFTVTLPDLGPDFQAEASIISLCGLLF